MADPKTVTLIDRDGGEYSASHPADVVNLVYGQGYKVKGGKTPEEAAALLAPAASEPVAAAQAIETKPAK